MCSMSGYGRGWASAGRKRKAGLRLVCEIRTVNHRYLDVVVSLPSALSGHEPVLRRLVAGRMKRGRVEVSVSVSAGRGGGLPPVVDERLARWYAKKMLRISRAAGLKPPGGEMLAGLPGVVSRPEGQLPAAGTLPLLREAVGRALDRALAMRRREGAALAADLGRRLQTIDRDVAWLAVEWPKYQRRVREKTDSRLKALIERLGEEKRGAALRELVAQLERGDVTEELTRLRSHLDQFRAALQRGSPTGRKLDFLAQEIQREIHTTGAKSSDALVGRRVVDMKEEVERIREQVQNLE